MSLTCEDPAGFGKWLDDVGREAAGKGISAKAIEVALAGVTYDPGIIGRDRGQKFFRQSFEQFSAKMVPPYRIQKGTALLRQHSGAIRLARLVLARCQTEAGPTFLDDRNRSG